MNKEPFIETLKDFTGTKTYLNTPIGPRVADTGSPFLGQKISDTPTTNPSYSYQIGYDPYAKMLSKEEVVQRLYDSKSISFEEMILIVKAWC